uniref:30S ribosomal protein S2 n=1 Tax=Nephromyces sp. ex Molgula occidentalis TaxID=2544991 RepID=A0A5C1H827_9APIC|nr:30S ribosomal protein S2 [Nephromyces sp. ex Molgula occidentalis]
MNLITLKELINSGVQIGNISYKSDLKKNKFIYKIINNVCIIDLIQTSKYLLKAYIFLYKTSFYNKNLIFIDSNKINKTLIKKTAKLTKQYYITEPFVPGMFSNWKIFYNNILLLNWVDNVIQILQNKSIFNNLNYKNKKEIQNIFNKLNYKFKNFKGIIQIPDIIIFLDINKNKQAFKEAKYLNKIIISIIDTDSNSDLINLPIPGNNKNYFSIKIILEILTTAIIHGNLKNQLLISNLN